MSWWNIVYSQQAIITPRFLLSRCSRFPFLFLWRSEVTDSSCFVEELDNKTCQLASIVPYQQEKTDSFSNKAVSC